MLSRPRTRGSTKSTYGGSLSCGKGGAAQGVSPADGVRIFSIAPFPADGSWCGKPLEEVQSTDSDGVGRWLADTAAVPHGGESIANLFARTEQWLDGRKLSGHTIAITPTTLIRAVIVLALDAPGQSFWHVDVSPGSITDLRWNGRFWKLRNSGCLFS
jgi:broad specificity phosphatase PhoE